MGARTHIILFLIIFLIAVPGRSQVPQVWYFGQYARMDMNGPVGPQIMTGSVMSTQAGCAVSDNGDFYSNGQTVWSGSTVIINGNNLDGNPLSTQSALFVKPYKSIDTILLFTTDAAGGSKGLKYNRIMGHWVKDKNIPLLPAVSEKLALTRHCNRQEWWVLAHGWGNNNFYCYRITHDSLNPNPGITAIGSVHGGNTLNAAGQMKFNMDGNKVALAITGEGKVELFRFDNTTGSLYDAITLTGFVNPYGIEFDFEGNYLYVSEVTGKIYQLDVSQWNYNHIVQSKTLIVNNIALNGSLQIAYNHKIYLARDNATYLSCINYPNVQGTGCNFELNAAYLGGAHCEAGLPPTHLAPEAFEIKGIKICLGDTAFFKISGDTTLIDSVLWDFGDDMTTDDTSTFLSPYYIYPKQLVYRFKVSIYYCDSLDTLDNYCDVMGPPNMDLGPDTSYCDNDIPPLNPGIAQYYLWNDGDTTPVKWITAPGTYWVKGTNSCGESSDTVVIKDIFGHPAVALPNDTALCIPESLALSSPWTSPYMSIWQDSIYSTIFIVNRQGNYTLTVVDTNGCKGKDSIYIAYDTIPAPHLGHDTVICHGEKILINGNTVASHYQWNTGANTPGISVSNSGVYILTAENHCGRQSDSVRVEVSPCRQAVAVPSAFTPNGDGINDIFLPLSKYLSTYHLMIFNRWGQLVFETYNPDEGWDGKYNGKEAQSGVYTWRLDFSDYYNRKFTEYGYVVLLK